MHTYHYTNLAQSTVDTAIGVLKTNGSLALTLKGSDAGNKYYLRVMSHGNARRNMVATDLYQTSITRGLMILQPLLLQLMAAMR